MGHRPTELNPLKGERLIILADPQRMIPAGAQAVDGWAKENGFTVLFCSGNLKNGDNVTTRDNVTTGSDLVSSFYGLAKN
jgi:hypothetical protein